MLRSSVHVLGTVFFEYLPLELFCLNTYFFFSKRLVYLAHLLCLWASLAFVRGSDGLEYAALQGTEIRLSTQSYYLGLS